MYLFIYYKLRQEAWITHRASSTTRSRKEEKKKQRKLVKQLTKMKNTLVSTKKKKKGNAKTELGRTSIKNQQHIRSSKLFNGRLVWHLIHTLLKVWEVPLVLGDWVLVGKPVSF